MDRELVLWAAMTVLMVFVDAVPPHSAGIDVLGALAILSNGFCLVCRSYELGARKR